MGLFFKKRNYSVYYFLHRTQGSKGIRQWLMYIPNDNTKNYPFCRLKLVVETFGQLT